MRRKPKALADADDWTTGLSVKQGQRERTATKIEPKPRTYVRGFAAVF